MIVVVDASLLAGAVLNEPLAVTIEAQIDQWVSDHVVLAAPTLMRYEVANAITRAVARERISPDDIPEMWEDLLKIPVEFHEMGIRGPEIAKVALTLGRRNVYDAAYIVLAQQLEAELWTLDGPLARNALDVGFPVNLIR